MAPLDKWDIAFIKHFKSGEPLSMSTLLSIWAERCGVDANPFHAGHIVEYLANLIDRLDLTPDLFITLTYLRPSEGWKVGCPEDAGHNDRVIYVMASWLRNTEVKYLPGYREAIEAEKVANQA